MHCDHGAVEALQPFFDDGWLSSIVREIKSGKEATVYCCTPGARGGDGLVAAKVYRPRTARSFRNDAIYQAGRVHLARDGRVKRAATAGTRFGREASAMLWVDHEWQMLRRLHDAGAAVPRPIARAEQAILMEFIGAPDGRAAPPLEHAEVAPAEADLIAGELLATIELMLHLHVVHGDLSPYNVLYTDEGPVVIDLPQAIDPRLNPAAAQLLARDVENVCRWATRRGARRAGAPIAADLWRRFVEGEIG